MLRSVAPYGSMAGRIFDKRSEKWAGDGARAHAAKQLASPALIANASDPAFLASLQTYDEEYGSHAPFAVMCPHTAYWQDTIGGDVVGALAAAGVDGVYVDQIAAAGPPPITEAYEPSGAAALRFGFSSWENTT